MENEFDVILTGSDGPVEGIAKRLDHSAYDEAYEFISVDETVHLLIAKEHGNWIRVAGTEPYFSGWADELVDQIK